MPNKNRKFKSNSVSNRRFRRARFGRDGHLIRGTRVRSSDARRDEILLPENSSLLERNLEEVIKFTSFDFVEDLERDILLDNEVSSAFGNTMFVNDGGNPVNDEAQKSACRAVIHTAIDDTARMVIENQEELFSEEEFAEEVKNNALDRLDTLRTEAEAEKEEQNEPTEEKEEKSFFGRLHDKFSKKVEVSGRSVIKMFETAKRDMQEYAQQIAEKAPSVKSKVLANKWHKCKTKIAAVAVVAVSALGIGCSNSSTPTNVQSQPAPRDSVEQVVDSVAPVDSTVVPTVTLQAAADTIKVPTEYSDSLGVSRSAFESTVKFDNNSFTQQVDDSKTIDGFAFAYKRVAEVMSQIKNSVAGDSLANDSVAQTPMQVLNSHRYIRSMYPNPDRMEKLGIKDSVLVEAAKAAQELDQFLNDCTDTIPQNISSMFAIEQIPGNMNVYATGIEAPCDDAKVLYQKVNVRQNPTDSIVNQADTISAQTTFDDLSSTLKTDTATFYKDVVLTGANTLNKSNENFSDAEVVRGADSKEFVDLSAKDKTILAEQTLDADTTQTEFDDFVEVPEASVDTTQTTFDDVMEIATDSLKASVDTTQTEFDDFVEVADSSLTAPQKAFDANQTLSTDSIETEIVFDSDSVAIGTPSAGYVPERGGYNNTGVTLDRIKLNKRILGEETYQAIIDNTPADWYNKGGPAAGLTPEQWADIVTVMNHTGPNQATTTAIMEFINCGKKIDEETMTAVINDVNGVRINRTRDGWTYSKPVYVRKVNNNGCDKKRTLDQVRQENGKNRTASGPKYPRLFKKTTVVRQTAFDDLPSILVKEEATDSLVAAQYTLVKSNENFSDSKVVRTASEDEVINRQVSSDKKVYTQGTETAQKKVKASIMRKRAAKIAQRYEKQAKEAGLTGNLDVDMKTAEGSKFAQEFLAKNKMDAKNVIDYQSKNKKSAATAMAYSKAADTARA